MSTREFLINEYQSLRNEIISVKECQLGILKWAYSILGAVIAFSWGLVFVKEYQKIDALFQPKYALPAAIVLIVGTILGTFLVQIVVHKTRSVFRMCGYVRVIEKLLSKSEAELKNYPGYENAFNNLRDIQQEKEGGFDIDLKTAWKGFVNDWKRKFKKEIDDGWVIRKGNDDHKTHSLKSGKYYRRIAFQIHFLGFICLTSSIFLLILSTATIWWKFVIFFFCLISVGFWIIAVIRCIAQTLMQEIGNQSIDGQFSLWKNALSKSGFKIDC